MREVYRKKEFLCMAILTLSLSLLIKNPLQAQSGRMRVEVRVDMLSAQKDSDSWFRGKNDYRFDLWINNKNYELEFEMNQVGNDDLPKEVYYTNNNTISEWINYGQPVTVHMEAWEEDCGGDNDYNTCDDVYCNREYEFPYQNTEPGVWHRILDNSKNPFWCPLEYTAVLYFKWSPPTPPDPVPQTVEVCKDEVTAQFNAREDVARSNFISRYEWQILKKVRKAVYATDLECDMQCLTTDAYGSSYVDEGCKYQCMNTPVSYKYEYEVTNNYDVSDQTSSTLSYSTKDDTLWVKYREIYPDATSAWSAVIPKGHKFYKAEKPTNLETCVTDNAGNCINTNFVCEGQTIKLMATMAALEVANHKFYWYKRANATLPFTLIDSTDVNEFVDNDNQIDTYQTLQYGVVTRRLECTKTYSDTVASATVFTFQGPVTNIDFDVTPATCPNSQDGKLTIQSAQGGADSVYYNIGKVKEDGTISYTTIQSSEGKVHKNQKFVFPDNLTNGFGLDTGSYLLQVINGGGIEENDPKKSNFGASGYCYAEFNFSVSYLPELAVTQTSAEKEISCYGGKDGSLSVDFINAQGNVEVTLKRSEANSFSNPVNVNSSEYTKTVENNSRLIVKDLVWGYYQLEITDDIQCKTIISDIVYLSEPAPLTLPATNVTRKTYPDKEANPSEYNDISCKGAANASITIKPVGGNRTNKYMIRLKLGNKVVRTKSNFTEATFNTLDPGTYTVEVTDCSGDIVTREVIITEPDLLKIQVQSTEAMTCYGVANGTIEVKALGGIAPFKFKIDNKAWVNAVDRATTVRFDALDAGVHTITLEDVNQCRAQTYTFSLEYPTPFSFAIDSVTMPKCYGGLDGRMIIRPFGGEYDAANFATESYKVTLSSTKLVKDEIVLRGDVAIFDNLPGGDYQVIIEDSDPAHGCATDSMIFLPEPTPLIIQVVDTVMPSCSGAADGAVKITASGGTPGETPDYLYSMDGINYIGPNEEGIAMFEGLEAGDYTFYAIDSHHDYYPEGAVDPAITLCVGQTDFRLEEPDLITIYTTMYPATCYGGSSGSITVDTITGGQGTYSQQWEMYDPAMKVYRALSPANPQGLENLAQGSYKLTVYDKVGCQASTVVEVTQAEMPLAIDTVQRYTESCEGTSDGKMQIHAKGGYPPYSYQLDAGAFQSYGFFDGLAAGAYNVTVKDQAGCEASQTINLSTELLIVEVSEILPATVGMHDGLLRLDVSGGKNKSYYIDGKLNASGAEFSELAAGDHTVVIHYNNGCVTEKTYPIGEIATSVAELRVFTQSLQPVSCSETQDGNVTVQVNGGLPPYTFLWDDSRNQTSATATGLGKGSYSVTVTDTKGAIKKYTTIVDGPDTFEVANAFAISSACYQAEDGRASVSVVGGTLPYTYQWDDIQQQTTAEAVNLKAGTYKVTVTDYNGCELMHEITVTEPPALEDILTQEEITLCTGQSIQLDAGSEWVSYRWTGDNGFSSENRLVHLTRPGLYVLEVTSIQGCVVTDTLRLKTSDNLIEARFLLPTEIIAGDTIALTEVSWPVPEQMVWSYSDNVKKFKSEGEKEYVIFPEPGEYTIALEVWVGNCTDIIEKKVVVGTVVASQITENGRLGYETSEEILLFPNPNQGIFILKVCTQQQQDIQVSIYDPMFKHRYYRRTFWNTDKIDAEINISSLKSGVYTMVVETKSEIKVLRLIIN